MQAKPIKSYKNVFFDLDRTLWDFQSNSEAMFEELINRHFPELSDKFDQFLNVYYPINEKLWVNYRQGYLSKEVLRTKRFTDTFKNFGVDNPPLVHQFGEDYIKESPTKSKVFPHTYDILEYLSQKGYNLYLLTNGFKEVQVVKIKHSKLEPYFKRMITSEDAGYQKPHRKMFEYALKSTNSKKKESIMIGDDLSTDITGAKKFGMDCVFANFDGQKQHLDPTFEIKSLNDLRYIL